MFHTHLKSALLNEWWLDCQVGAVYYV